MTSYSTLAILALNDCLQKRENSQYSVYILYLYKIPIFYNIFFFYYLKKHPPSDIIKCTDSFGLTITPNQYNFLEDTFRFVS